MSDAEADALVAVQLADAVAVAALGCRGRLPEGAFLLRDPTALRLRVERETEPLAGTVQQAARRLAGKPDATAAEIAMLGSLVGASPFYRLLSQRTLTACARMDVLLAGLIGRPALEVAASLRAVSDREGDDEQALRIPICERAVR